MNLFDLKISYVCAACAHSEVVTLQHFCLFFHPCGSPSFCNIMQDSVFYVCTLFQTQSLSLPGSTWKRKSWPLFSRLWHAGVSCYLHFFIFFYPSLLSSGFRHCCNLPIKLCQGKLLWDSCLPVILLLFNCLYSEAKYAVDPEVN